jgi:hypothetical protein
LINNPAGLAANLLSAYALAGAAAAGIMGAQWGLGRHLEACSYLLTASALIAVHRVIYRTVCVGRTYGWGLAAFTPIRMTYANLINSVAAVNALCQFATAKILRKPLSWAKTAHEYPAQLTLATDNRRIGELLVARGAISGDQLAAALKTKPLGHRLGEHLVHQGLAREEDVYDALSAQHGFPQSPLEPAEIPRVVARALPAEVARECRAIPFRVEFASMFLAVPEVPTTDLRNQLSRYTTLDLRFHLVTPTNFEQLLAELL